jgi:hypothetical protein
MMNFACSTEWELPVFDQANLDWAVIVETHKVILPVYDLRQNNVSCDGSTPHAILGAGGTGGGRLERSRLRYYATTVPEKICGH